MATLNTTFQRLSGRVQQNYPLTDEQIFRAAPSVFATAAHESRSSRYTHIPTIDVVNGLRREGFEPFFACQAHARQEGKRDFAKHMLRFRQFGDIARERGEETNEVILINSHDGASSYQMLAGCFRFVCSNGLICGDSVGDFRVRHSGDVVGQVIEGAYSVVGEFERVTEARDRMRAIELSPRQQSAFATAALQLRYDPDDKENPAPIVPSQLLRVRRREDTAPDLWRTFNVVQENVLKGGLHGRNAEGRRTTTRAVKSVTENVRLNRALWTLAEEMAKLAA